MDSLPEAGGAQCGGLSQYENVAVQKCCGTKMLFPRLYSCNNQFSISVIHFFTMTLQQLNYLCEIVNSGFNLSRAAKVLHTSQPGVSRYIKLLEQELGLELLVRNKKKIMGLTPGGSAIAQAARQIVSDVGNLKPIARDYNTNVAGRLSIATSHAQARYTLPKVVERFVKKYPQVLLRLRQGYSSQ